MSMIKNAIRTAVKSGADDSVIAVLEQVAKEFAQMEERVEKLERRVKQLRRPSRSA